jgi:hypothetical protein
MKPGGRGLRRAPWDEMTSCKGRLENCLKALLYSADGGRAVARALGRGDRRHARAAARGLRRSSIPQTLRKPLFPQNSQARDPRGGYPGSAVSDGNTEREQPHLATGARELFLRQLPVTTDPGARLLEVVSRLGGATSHATPSFTSARLREPRIQTPPGLAPTCALAHSRGIQC